MNYDKAYDRVQQLKKFYKNLMWFGIISVIILGNDWIDNGWQYKILGGHLFLTIWAVILIVKAASLFIFDEEWEKDIIEKEIKKDKKTLNL